MNRRLSKAVAAGRAKSSATWKVGNVGEQAKVRQCTAVKDLVHEDGNLGPDTFRNTQPMKADECVSDVVRVHTHTHTHTHTLLLLLLLLQKYVFRVALSHKMLQNHWTNIYENIIRCDKKCVKRYTGITVISLVRLFWK